MSCYVMSCIDAQCCDQDHSCLCKVQKVGNHPKIESDCQDQVSRHGAGVQLLTKIWCATPCCQCHPLGGWSILLVLDSITKPASHASSSALSLHGRRMVCLIADLAWGCIACASLDDCSGYCTTLYMCQGVKLIQIRWTWRHPHRWMNPSVSRTRGFATWFCDTQIIALQNCPADDLHHRLTWLH